MKMKDVTEEIPEMPETTRRGFLVGSMSSMIGASLFGKLGWKQAPGAERRWRDGEPTYRIGVGKVDITPTKPMNMAGYGTRNKPGLGTAYHPLYASCLTIDDGRNRTIFVHADLVSFQGWSTKTGIVTNVRQAMLERHGIGAEQIAFVPAHVHNGPVVSAPEFNRDVTQKIIDLIDRTLAGARPGRLYFGRGSCDIAVNRRSNDAGGNYLWSLINRYGATDHEVIVLKAVDLKGKPFAVAFNYACHPITIGGYEYGSDFIGFAVDAIEKEVPGATALFLQGCAGDQRPDCPDANDPLAFHSSLIGPDKPNPALPAGFGRRLGASVVEALRKPMEPVTGAVRSSLGKIELPVLAGVKPDTKKPTWVIPTNFTTGDWTNTHVEKPWPESMRAPERRWLRLAELIRDSVNPDGTYKISQPAEILVTRIGDKFIHVGLCGEPTVAIGLRLKDQLRGHNVMVTGYTGFSTGYFLAAAQIIEGGYEAFAAGKKVPYSPEAEDVVINKAMRLAEEMKTA
ncbi:MAG: neutral/alkaline non-lysosomal ceramidase N-terminal domain-containing protein [Candidatus Sumerlaeia bacterium]